MKFFVFAFRFDVDCDFVYALDFAMVVWLVDWCWLDLIHLEIWNWEVGDVTVVLDGVDDGGELVAVGDRGVTLGDDPGQSCGQKAWENASMVEIGQIVVDLFKVWPQHCGEGGQMFGGMSFLFKSLESEKR